MNSLKFWDLITSGIMLAGAILFGWQTWLYESVTITAAVGVTVFIVGIVIGVIKIRCPFCKHFLGLAFSGKFCPHCGDKIK